MEPCHKALVEPLFTHGSLLGTLMLLEPANGIGAAIAVNCSVHRKRRLKSPQFGHVPASFLPDLRTHRAGVDHASRRGRHRCRCGWWQIRKDTNGRS